jgi:hypothetical protein
MPNYVRLNVVKLGAVVANVIAPVHLKIYSLTLIKISTCLCAKKLFTAVINVSYYGPMLGRFKPCLTVWW